MAENTVVYDIRIEGTEQQATRLSQIDAELAQLNKQRKEYIELMKNNVKLDKESEKHLAQITATTKALSQEKAKLNREINNTIKANTAATKSYNALVAENGKLNARLKEIQDPLGKNRKEFTALAAQINSNTDKLKEMDAAMGNHQRNVGNYSGAIKDAFGQMGFFSRELAIASSAMNVLKTSIASSAGAAGRFKTAMNIVKVALVSTGIGALVVAFGSLMTYFKSTGDRANELKNTLAPIKVFFENLKDVVEGVGGTLFKAFTNIGDFWTTIRNGFKETREQLSGLMEETRKETELQRWVNNTRRDLYHKENQWIIERAKLEAKEAEARANAKDAEVYGIVERMAFMGKAQAINEQIFKKEDAMRRQRLAAMIAEQTISETNDEDLRERYELEADIFKAEQEFNQNRKGMFRELLKLENEMKQAIKERNEANTIGAMQALNMQQQAAQMAIDTTLRTEATRTAITQMEADKRKAIEAEGNRWLLENLSETLGMAASLTNQHTAAYKVAASGEALINTYLSASKALADIRIPFNFVMAALLTAKGLSNVAKINNVKFAGGGVVPSGYELPGSRSNEDNTLALVKPGEVVLNKHQQNAIGGPGVFKSIGVPGFASGGLVPSMRAPLPSASGMDWSRMTSALGDQRVYVLESDITKKQKNVRVIESLSSF